MVDNVGPCLNFQVRYQRIAFDPYVGRDKSLFKAKKEKNPAFAGFLAKAR
ncbi:MAG: hypothetical protein VX447_17660 [Pseudomonadota bacterium]|nr:hypothetical protein [Gallaecimonas pentaromativorans]MED5526563.1 hypothetical protein [Pseudomonadota bacterium]